MEITTTKELDTNAQVLVLGLYKEDKSKYGKLNPDLAKDIESAIKRKVLKEEFGATLSTKITNSAYESVLIIHLGEKKKLDEEHLRRAFHKAVVHMKNSKYESFTTNLAELSRLKPDKTGRAAAEGLLLSAYSFDKYKEKKDKTELGHVSLLWTKNSTMLKKGLKTGTIIAESTNYTRDLVNEPASVVTPSYLEKEAKKLSKVSVKVLNKEDMNKLGMGALLAVAKGSDLPPKLILIHYKNKGPLTALIGKGVTFDSGGILVKPMGYIEDMKSDMSGAAAVLGTMKAITELNLKKNVLAVIPACENMINGSAFRPGDILKAYNGKTIEVGHTDAEGRLILADALSYTEDKYKPNVMIDIATLTGACMIALGPYTSGILTKDDKLLEQLQKAGYESYDRVWPLPMFEEFDDAMEGEISDLNNMALKLKSYGGATTAAVFLNHFVKNTRWAHIDIAGTAFPKDAKHYNKKGSANGAGVRLLTYWLMG